MADLPLAPTSWQVGVTTDARGFSLDLLLDTGADRTIIAPRDGLRLLNEFDVDVRRFPPCNPSLGMGGAAATTYLLDASLTLDAFTLRLPLTALDPSRSSLRIPSVLGRDVISQFALYVEENHGLVLLLAPHEAEALRSHLPIA